MDNWHERYKAMKKGLGWTNSDVARESGNTPDSIKNATQPANEIPRMLKLAIVVYERLSAKEGGEK
jgi:predicted transcriptional regulator